MKTLVLIRHAKSSWEYPYLADDLRPLNPRGKRDAPLIGQELNRLGFKPDIVLSSPAVRARATAILVTQELDFDTNSIQLEETLYTFSDNGDVVLDLVRKLSDDLSVAFVFGHNDTFHQLANRLSSGQIPKFSTCAVCIAVWNQKQWSMLNASSVNDWQWIYPKGLK